MTYQELCILKQAAEILDDNGREILGEQVRYVVENDPNWEE